MNAIQNDLPISVGPEQDEGWLQVRQRLLAAVAVDQRVQVMAALTGKTHMGAGLRDWLSAMRWRRAVVPDQIPRAVIDVYLADSDVLPLYDCADCGTAIPVKIGRCPGMEDQPARTFFTHCPWCGGPTGWHLHCWKQVNGAHSESPSRPNKPR